MNTNRKFRSDDQREEAQAEDFIPFACHYDPATLLTKNGELLQTIKIVGFTFESVNKGDHTLSLRSSLRKAILDSVQSSKFAIWFHTVRRKKNLATGGSYPDEGFAEHLNQEWCKRHDWEHKYVNELYVTIIREGQNFDFGVGSFFRSLVFAVEKKYREKYLGESFEELNTTVERILSGLQEFGARRLTMNGNDGTTYSEPIQFFGKILNLKETPMPVPVSDISEYMRTHRTLFGFSALEVMGETGDHFASILSVKEYHEVTSTSIDEFLQLDQQFIITETFDFINSALIQKKFEHQKYILELSEDKEFASISGLNDILKSNRDMPTDFGEHQITIMLVEDDLEMLEEETLRMVQALHELGIVAIKEDVMLEDCYWAQLPGNFEFLRRLSPINTAHTGGFASLYNFPAGLLDDNHWGNATTVFYTKAKTPYFFNFHEGDNGHTTIVGPYGTGKTVLLNFLVSEAIKYDPRIIFFDQQRASELFIRALEGSYTRMLKSRGNNQVQFNPLKLEDSEENRSFIKTWLYYLMMDENHELPEEIKLKIPEAVEYNFGMPSEQRKLSTLAAKFWPITEESKEQIKLGEQKAKEEIERADVEILLKKAQENLEEKEEEDKGIPLPQTPEGRLSFWYGDGKFAHYFDNDEDQYDINVKIMGFDLTEVVQEKWAIIPVFSYLLHRVTQTLDGKPTIVVLDEAWLLVDNPIFAPKLGELLDELRQKNAMVIFATESVDDATKSSISNTLLEKVATQIYLSNKDATESYKTVFGLSDKEFEMLNEMDVSERHFLLKHHGESVVAQLNLVGMEDIIAILSGNRENIALVESIVLEVGDEPKKWLPVFRQRYKK